MKILQKLILPALIFLAVFIIYKFYFTGGIGLGSFDDFDPNNSAVKEIRVKLLIERGTELQGEEISFFTSDKNGRVVKVSGTFELPDGFKSAREVLLRGHLTQSSFHAHEVLID